MVSLYSTHKYKEEHTMDQKKPFTERPADERQKKQDEFDAANAADPKKKETHTDVDEVINKESYRQRNHGRTHDGSADVSNPGTT